MNKNNPSQLMQKNNKLQTDVDNKNSSKSISLDAQKK